MKSSLLQQYLQRKPTPSETNATTFFAPHIPALDTQEIINHTQKLFRQGAREIITPALSKKESESFEQAGYTVKENLHLLKRTIGTETIQRLADTVTIRKARYWHQKQILAIDSSCFNNFWRFTTTTLKAAQKATATSTTLLLHHKNQKIGYVIAGKVADNGYIHRLAVKPAHSNKGYGTALLIESLLWLQSQKVSVVYVNTQISNKKAVRLYEKTGFFKEPNGLVVLHRKAPV